MNNKLNIMVKKKQFIDNYNDKHKFSVHKFDNVIVSVTRKSDSKTFKLGDEIYNCSPGSYGAPHKIAKFEIKQRCFSILETDKSSIDEIWVTYDKDSGGEWLCNINFYNETMKQKIKNWWKNFVEKNIVKDCPEHLNDLF
jgi:hypothetical protein